MVVTCQARAFRDVAFIRLPGSPIAWQGEFMIEAVVFDLDGVLLDSEPVWEQVRREVVRWPLGLASSSPAVLIETVLRKASLASARTSPTSA